MNTPNEETTSNSIKKNEPKTSTNLIRRGQEPTQKGWKNLDHTKGKQIWNRPILENKEGDEQPRTTQRLGSTQQHYSTPTKKVPRPNSTSGHIVSIDLDPSITTDPKMVMSTDSTSDKLEKRNIW